MENTEFELRIQQIEDEYKLSKRNLYIQYVKENAEFKVGDIIGNGITTIMIDSIQAMPPSPFFNNKYPTPMYCGFDLKKDLTPRKDKLRRQISKGTKINNNDHRNQPKKENAILPNHR